MLFIFLVMNLVPDQPDTTLLYPFLVAVGGSVLYILYFRHQLRGVYKARYPTLRAIEALILVAAMFLAVFSIVSARERRWFWSTMPSTTLVAALLANAITGAVLAFAGLPGLTPLPWRQAAAIFTYALVVCLFVNDALKVVLIKWRVPGAVA